MATKRTPIKRRRRSARERLNAWRWTFTTGHDFFGDLKDWGIVHPVDVWPPEKQPAAERAFLKAAREAWDQLGLAFLEGWKPTAAREVPWAREQFGEPRHGHA